MIPKIKFQYNKNKDYRNIWEACNKEVQYGYDFTETIPKDILQICKGKSFEECKGKIGKKLKEHYPEALVESSLQLFEKSWKKIEKEYFNRLEDIMKQEFYAKKIDVYLTHVRRCPYNPDKDFPNFFINAFSNNFGAVLTSAHEIMHLQFHNNPNWIKAQNEIGNKKTNDLKESLTVLLNLEFEDLINTPDRGYPAHVKLREYIAEQWNKDKDFDRLIDSSIKWIKTNGVN